MKRFLSMLAMAVLVLQSAVTSLVYAADQANPSEESDSVSAVETAVVDEIFDEGSNELVTTDLTNTDLSVVEEPTGEMVSKFDTPIIEEQPIIETEVDLEESDFYLPIFNLFKFPVSPILTRALNTENPQGACNSQSIGTCIVNPVHTVGSLENPGDVQITKVVEATDIDGEYKITVEVKGNPVETVETTANNICSVVVFDRSASMNQGKQVQVCVEGYAPGECKKWNFWHTKCTQYAQEGDCKKTEWQRKKRADAVAGAKIFAATLNGFNENENIAKIGLVTFAGAHNDDRTYGGPDYADVKIGQELSFSDLSDANFGEPWGGTNLDAGLLKAQELINGDDFCKEENAKKYIVVITDGAPTYAGDGADIFGEGYETEDNINSVLPRTKEDAKNIKEDGIEIFTIGYQLSTNIVDTYKILREDIASSPDYAYEGEDADKVAEAFQKISETIKEYAAGTEANLEDKIGANVTIVTSNGNQEPNKLENFTITEDGQTIEFYVKIVDGAENGDYDTNAGVYLTYTGYNPETGEPIPGQELSIGESSKIHWVQPPCGGTQPTIVEGVTKMGASTYPRKWNEAGNALIPVGYSEWTYVNANPNLEACEWTCDGGYEYDEQNNTCLKKHIVTVNPNCAEGEEGEDCKVITGEIIHGSEYTLPSLTRSYTLTYDENGNISTETASAEFLGYCIKNAPCDTPIPAGIVTITDDVEYIAEWNEEGLTLTVKGGQGYQDAENVRTFINWLNLSGNVVEVNELLKLIKNETLTAQYNSTTRQYTITFVDEDKTTVLGEGKYNYGTPASEIDQPENPTKDSDDTYTYQFAGWNPVLAGVTKDMTYVATYTPAGCVTGKHIEENVGTTSDTLNCVSDYKDEGVECKQEGAPAHAHYNITTGAGTWDGTDYVGVNCSWDCDSGYKKDGNTCRTSGGGGGSSSSSYSCKNLPDNAVANNTLKPNSSTDYSYSTDTSKVCTFQCKTNYTRDENNKKCVKSGGGNGGEEVIELGGQVSDKCSVEGSNYSEEEKAAYLYACENDITTIRDIEDARLGDFLTRAEMAKMISVFATKQLGMKPDTSKDCSNFADSMEGYSQEMKDYMVMSCQLEIMGIHTTNYKAIPDFMPRKYVSRAEFGTVLSRLLWGNKYEGTNENYYVNHLNALKDNGIITNIDPNITEYRARVLLMLYRSVEAIKSSIVSINNETVEEQVNEELKEESQNQTESTTIVNTGAVTETGNTNTDIQENASKDTPVETGSTNTGDVN